MFCMKYDIWKKKKKKKKEEREEKEGKKRGAQLWNTKFYSKRHAERSPWIFE